MPGDWIRLELLIRQILTAGLDSIAWRLGESPTLACFCAAGCRRFGPADPGPQRMIGVARKRRQISTRCRIRSGWTPTQRPDGSVRRGHRPALYLPSGHWGVASMLFRGRRSLRSCILLASIVASGGCAARVPVPAESLWTLWEIKDGGDTRIFKTGLDQQTCATYRDSLGAMMNMYVEIDRDVVMMKEKPVGKRVQFRCRPDGERLE